MPTLLLTPEALDLEAARIADHDAAFRAITARWHESTPEPAPRTPAREQSGHLVTKTVDQLVAEAGIALGPSPPQRVLGGRLARALPDWAHHTRPRTIDAKPSDVLHTAHTVLQEWGWQGKRWHLRDARGRRCVCGAVATAHALGVGMEWQAHRACAHILAVLRAQGWTRLIGEWNAHPERTAEQAIAVVAQAADRARAAGE